MWSPTSGMQGSIFVACDATAVFAVTLYINGRGFLHVLPVPVYPFTTP